jgi:predicted HAD superfamily Cof-like phosphohydrolase
MTEYMVHARHAYDTTTRHPDSRDQADYTYQLEESLDGLVDLVYVAIGTAYMHGFDFQSAWDRVHEANMKKIRAPSAEASKRKSSFDVVKPEGWEPPTHTDLVEDNDCMDPHLDRA